MTFNNLLVSIENRIQTITINRPSKMNALNIETIGEIDVAITQAIENNDVSGIILTGAGEKAFVAGADISEFAGFNSDEGIIMGKNGHNTFNKIENSPKPVIAAVNGFALGGGCELAMACHMRVASENARFGQPEVNLGIIPGYGGTQRLTQLVGKGKAIELMTTGDMIKADEAKTLGLANHVVPSEELIAFTTKILSKIGSKAPIAIQKVIESVNNFYEKEVDGFDYEVNAFGDLMNTEDFKEGTSAFLEKRKAEFKGK